MSDHDDNDEFEDPDEGNENESSVIKGLRKQARENAGAAAERDALARKLAFMEAGVPATKATAYFAKAYDGELDAESIKAAAVEAGFLEAPKDEQSDEEREAHERTLDASGGSTDDTSPPGYAEELAAAKSTEETLAVIEKYKSPTTGV